MIGVVLAIVSLFMASIPALVYWRNRREFLPLPMVSASDSLTLPTISVLIPARNEEATIEKCLRSVLANRWVEMEVILLDDHSEDRTGEIVQRIAADDARLRMVSGKELPAGWCGKQHACWQLSLLAERELLLFIDADVELSDDAILRSAVAMRQCDAALLSGFPRELTGSWFEHLMMPLIHYILLGFLPIQRLRRSTEPMYAAGCGQLMLVRRTAYDRTGGHASIRESLHDGLKLARLFRRHGLPTDIFAADGIARCRMYHGAAEVWRGLGKNATEGIANSTLILPFTFLLFGSSVLAPLLLMAGFAGLISPAATVIAGVAVLVGILPRLGMAVGHGHHVAFAWLHPVAVLVFLLIQWIAYVNSWRGRTVTWKGRLYPAT